MRIRGKKRSRTGLRVWVDRQVEGGDEKEPDGGKTRKDGRKQPHGGSAREDDDGGRKL